MSATVPLYAKSKSAGSWQTIAQALRLVSGDVTDGVTFVFHEDGLTCWSMSWDKYSAVQIILPTASFEEFRCARGGTMVTLRVKDLVEVLGHADPADAFILSVPKDVSEGATLKLEGAYPTQYDLHTLPSPKQDPKNAAPSEITRLKITKEALSKAMEKLAIVSDEFTIHTAPEAAPGAGQIVFSAKGEGIGKSYVTLSSADKEKVKEFACTAESVATYKSDALRAIVKAVKSDAPPLTLRYQSTYPLVMDLDLDDKGGRLTYFRPPMAKDHDVT